MNEDAYTIMMQQINEDAIEAILEAVSLLESGRTYLALDTLKDFLGSIEP